MAAKDEITRLLGEAARSMKGDLRGAIVQLETAYTLAREGGDGDDAAAVAEELSRGWARRRSAARSLYYASNATELAPGRKSAWTTLAKACELVASRTDGAGKQRRARALYRAAGAAFKKAASLARDPEDKHWLLELARDASRQAKPPA